MPMQRLRSFKILCPFPLPWRSPVLSSRGGSSVPFVGIPQSSSRIRSLNGSVPDVPFMAREFYKSSASVAKQEETGPVVEQIQMLKAVEDVHGGVIVEMEESMDSDSFVPLLRDSLSKWRLMGKRGVWIKLSIENAHLVASAVEEGFRYHHAEPDYLMLVHWLPRTTDTLPANASHRVGIGAFVMNDKKEVLVVQEKYGKFKDIGLWKLPTGVVNEGEDIHLAAIREVKEETGVETEFVEILAFRQTHNAFFTKSDLFFVCMLKPRSSYIQKQNLEIDAAQWMPIEEYSAQPFMLKNEHFKFVASICQARTDTAKEYRGFAAIPTTTGSGRLTHLYCNTDKLKLTL
ncbi:hypothetical protein CDL15_Pgr020111 [Punica granatum]|uniref:Nudix hydrolase domain-containing protein n=1 Tax=Punica granatum TaxID=22663 RepID=A0A218VQK8_PUNGR|nr:hypothetical protein CDL15_Pgr020111 [Punica granatum]